MTFNVLNPKVDNFISLPHRALVPISSKIGSFIYRMSCSEGRIDEWTGRVETIAALASLD